MNGREATPFSFRVVWILFSQVLPASEDIIYCREIEGKDSDERNGVYLSLPFLSSFFSFPYLVFIDWYRAMRMLELKQEHTFAHRPGHRCVTQCRPHGMSHASQMISTLARLLCAGRTLVARLHYCVAEWLAEFPDFFAHPRSKRLKSSLELLWCIRFYDMVTNSRVPGFCLTFASADMAS